MFKFVFVRQTQRYKCKKCNRVLVSGDKRKKYDNKIRKAAVILYLEGNGLRGIERILREIFACNVSFQLITQWIKQAGYIIEQEIANRQNINEKEEVVSIVEMDELFTYIQKKRITQEYGLLLTATQAIYLRFK